MGHAEKIILNTLAVDGPMTINRLADVCTIFRSTTIDTVKRLEVKGWIFKSGAFYQLTGMKTVKKVQLNLHSI